MTDAGTSAKPPLWRRGSTAIAAVAAVVTGVLTFSDGVREKGGNLVCAVAKASGAEERFSWCVKEPTEVDIEVHLNRLQAREKAGKLGDAGKAQLAAIEKKLEERAFKVLTAFTGAKAPPTDAKTKEDTRTAIRETVKEGDKEEQRAVKLIADGDVQGGLDLLTAQADAASSDIASKWRRIGRLAYGVDTARARDAYAKVVALDRSDPWDAIYLARLDLTAGSLAAGERTLSEARARYSNIGERLEMVLAGETGNVQITLGKLDNALASYRAALDIAKRLAESDPANTEWQRDLYVSHNKVGNIYRLQGNLDAALASYRAARALVERFTESDLSNARWLQDLSVSHIKIGDIQQAQGEFDAALASYRASLILRERLVESDPTNIGWQRELSVSRGKVGEIQQAQGNLDAALASYHVTLSIGKRLAERDPTNAGWQRDLSVTYEKIGEIQQLKGEVDDALTNYRTALALHERLVKRDSSNAVWQRDIYINLWRQAQIPKSGVRWTDVKTQLEQMDARGILHPPDRKYLEDARRRAAAER